MINKIKIKFTQMIIVGNRRTFVVKKTDHLYGIILYDAYGREACHRKLMHRYWHGGNLCKNMKKKKKKLRSRRVERALLIVLFGSVQPEVMPLAAEQWTFECVQT